MTVDRRLVGGVVAVLLLVALGLLVRDALAVEDALTAVRGDLDRTLDAVAEGDAAAAEQALAAAAAGLDGARTRADGPLWATARVVPYYGATARAVTDAVDLGEATVAVVEAGLTDLLPLVTDGAGAVVDDDGRVDTAVLDQLAADLAALPVDDLAAVRDRMADLPAGGLVGPAGPARDRAVAEADRRLPAVERGRAAAEALPGFLGADGARTYLLGMQNPAELRGTGGLLGYVAEITVEDGRIGLQTGLARRGGGGGDAEDGVGPGGQVAAPSQAVFGFDYTNPVARSEEFAARYDSNAGAAIVQSVNLDPDLPTVGPVLVELYRARTGREVDGVVLVDPFTLSAVVRATEGPLRVPRELVAGTELGPRLRGRDIPKVLLVDAYDAFEETPAGREVYLEAVTAAALDRLFGLQWNPATMLAALGDSTAERRLQVYAVDEDEQAAFAQLGLAGQMTSSDDVVDLLAVTGINTGPDKSDAHVTHRITAELELARLATGDVRDVQRSGTVTVLIENPLEPDDHALDITGTSDNTGVGVPDGERLRDARNRTLFTVWSPASTRLTATRDELTGQVLRTGQIHGHNAVDVTLETPSASRSSFAVPYAGPVRLEEQGGRLLYELELWRQAKAIPDLWDVTVTPPDGMDVLAVEVVGGGGPSTGLGFTSGRPVEAELTTDGNVRLQGAVTRDTRLRIWLDD